MEYIAGDIIMYDNKIGIIKYVRSSETIFDIAQEGYIYWLIDIDKIKPVSLTSEILVKSGWYSSEDLSISYVHASSGIVIEFLPHSEWKYISIGSEFLTKIRYIHELQHILWALKINTELKI